MKKITLLMVLLCLCTTLFSQSSKVNNNWFFSDSSTNGSGVSFNNTNGTPTVLTTSQAENPYASSSISDTDGNLLFYCDGKTVWNKNHIAMPNGILNHLGTSTPSMAKKVIIVPHLVNEEQYYIFTGYEEHNPNITNDGYYYNIVDMSLNNGDGDVLINVGGPLNDEFGQPFVNFHTSSKRLASHYNKDLNTIWITLLNGTKILTYKIDQNGLNINPVQASSEVASNTVPFSFGGMRISPDGTKIGMTMRSNDIDNTPFDALVANFDNNNGIISNIQFIEISRADDVEFSPDSRFIYVKAFGKVSGFEDRGITNSNRQAGLYYAPVKKDAEGFNNSSSLPPTFVGGLIGTWENIGSIQLGPDDKLYFNVLSVGTNSLTPFLYSINNPNDPGNISFSTILNLGQMPGVTVTNQVASLPRKVIDLNETEFSPFITTWEVDATDLSITIPTYSGETYDYTVDWGDGTSSDNQTSGASHTYSIAGTYTVSISGLFPRIYFLNSSVSNREKIVAVNQWGNNEWTSMSYAFYGCGNLDVLDISNSPNLTSTQDLSYAFMNCESLTQVGQWEVDNVNNMAGMFIDAHKFNQSLGDWNVSKVEDMSRLLHLTDLSIANYDATLIGWNNLPLLQNNVFFGATGLKYCSMEAQVARQTIIETYGWSIYLDSQGCSSSSSMNSLSNNFSTEKELLNKLYVYPNPFDDTLNITQSTSNAIASFSVYDKLGNIILQERVVHKDENIMMNTRSLEAGIYFVKIVFIDGASKVKQVIKN